MSQKPQAVQHQRQSRAGFASRRDALYRKGLEADDDVALAAAVERYRVLLTLQLREHVPLDWATTQDALGNALRGSVSV